MLFNFISDIGNYDDRVVGRYDSDDGKMMISTARVSDGSKPFETAFKHPEYNDGKMVIVDSYDTKDEAVAGHQRWTSIMVDGPLPDKIVDCNNSGISQFVEALGGDSVYERQSKATGQ